MFCMGRCKELSFENIKSSDTETKHSNCKNKAMSLLHNKVTLVIFVVIINYYQQLIKAIQKNHTHK